MITQQSSSSTALGRINIPSAIKSAWAFNPMLTIFTLAATLLTIIGAIGMLIDPRVVLGMPNWAKSTKFGISLSLYGAVLLWMLPMITNRPRLVRFVATGIGVTLLIEIVLLMVQATRGVPMHFNVSTPLNSALWGVMGFTITIFWGFTAVGVVLLLFQKMPNRVLAWSVRLGLLLTLIGFTEGFLMTSPNAPQRAALAAGQKLDLVGAHTVGGFDGGPGLPFAGWSTNHGDLRIGHFAGIHAAQIIPLLGILLLRRREKWLREGHRLALVAIGTGGYLGLVALVTWQALRDQPLLQPDALTLGALAGLLAATLALAGATLAHARLTAR